MASQIKVDTISEKTSTNGVTIDSVSLKDGKVATANSIDSDAYVDGSIDTAHIADDQITLAKMAAGTDGNIISYDASGNPVAIATGNDGQILTSTGAGSPPAFEDAPSGGLSVADQWRLTSDLTVSSTTSAIITANLERIDTGGQGVIGSMSESSGVFTFPSTGFYLVKADFSYSLNDNCSWIEGEIVATTDNSSYADMASLKAFIYRTNSDTTYITSSTSSLIDVTNTTNVKVKFGVARESNNVLCLGDTNRNETHFTFLRLGDT